MESRVDHNRISGCTLPDRTELQERTLKTEQDIIVGEKCRIDYGLSGKDVVVCEFSRINGSIVAAGDARIDNWCEVSGDVIVDEDAYLGEGVKILGKLVVRGDLDIGDNVQIERGFEAKGWISIRNPMPVIIYIVMYLVAILGIEREDELSSVLEKIFGDDEAPAAAPLMIPGGSVLDMQTFSVPDRMVIGSGCRLHGNIRAASIVVREDTTLFGSISLREDGSIARGSVIHGDLQSEGDLRVEEGVHILGNVSCRRLTLHEDARIDGVIRAPGGLKIERGSA